MSELFKRFEKYHLPGLAENTRSSYKDSLKPLRTFLGERMGDPRVDRVLAPHVRQYLKWRRFHGPHGGKREEPLSRRTLQRDHAVLRVAFEQAIEDGFVDANPCKAVKAPKPDKRQYRILKESEFRKLLEECRHNPMLATYVTLLYETGMRPESEALWIKWTDVDFEDGYIRVESSYQHRTKTGETRWVPASDRLLDRLREHAAGFRMKTYEGKRSPWVFHHTTTQRTSKAGKRVASMRRSFDAAAERAGVPQLRQHDLRHTRITRWIEEGKPLALVQKAVGHKSLATTQQYLHIAKVPREALVGPSEEEKERLAELKA